MLHTAGKGRERIHATGGNTSIPDFWCYVESRLRKPKVAYCHHKITWAPHLPQKAHHPHAGWGVGVGEK